MDNRYRSSNLLMPLCFKTIGSVNKSSIEVELYRNATGIYSIALDTAVFGMKIGNHLEGIPTASALQHPGTVFVLAKQQFPPSNEGILV